MKTASCEGQLVKWKDDRGFGFIKPNGNNKEIFLHISALKGANRRPKVGDIILYEQIINKDGKISAANASIQGVLSQNIIKPQRTKSQYVTAKQKPNQKRSLQIGGSILGIAAFGILAIFSNLNLFNRSVSNPSLPNATISKPSIPNPSLPNPTLLKPSIPNPSIPSPTIPNPSIPSPTIPNPSIPSPTIPNPSIPSPTIPNPSISSECNIKGNISVSSGAKFYHIQGMPEYEITRIDTSKGERFFCSESEAIANGCNKAPR